MARPEFRISSSVAVVGFALIALTPATPSTVRRMDAIFAHLYRPFDWVIESARAAVHPHVPESMPLPKPTRDRIRAGVRHWDDILRSGLVASAPEVPSVVARVVALDRARRWLLVDAGPGVPLEPGDPVAAGAVLVGRVLRANDGVAVVETPWSRDVRFAGAAAPAAEGEPIRFVARGLERNDVVAAVTNPERREGLAEGIDVFVPDVKDLLPGSIRAAPVGLLLGKLSLDSVMALASGEVAFLIRPSLDLELLDAVVIALDSDRATTPAGPRFERRPLERVTTSLLSTWRDGFVATGSNAQRGSAILADEHFVGVVEDARFGVVRIRGVFDPGNALQLLAITKDDAFPLEIVIRARDSSGAQARIVRQTVGRSLAAGDLLVSAGREAHVPRGLLVGTIVAIEDSELVVRAPHVAPGCRLDALTRVRYPANPWGG